MCHYYETSTQGEIQAHDTLEEAIIFATQNECDIIYEIGGNWEEYAQRGHCGDWIPMSELIDTDD